MITTKYQPAARWARALAPAERALTPLLLLLFAAVVLAHPEDEDILAELEAFGLISAEDPDPWLTIRTYLKVGIQHIVPKGLDHILFVLGLFLSTTRLKPLLIQVTSFTVAHTVSLGLSMYGAISLPSNIVEPLIAFSIAWVGIENVLPVQRCHNGYIG